jgi:polar amino acid transport system substrate-binding protein
MQIGRALLHLSLVAFVTNAHAAAPAPRLTVLTEFAPPSSMLEDGHAAGTGAVIGRSSDKVREVMQRTGVAYTMEIQPWKRAYTAALERRDTCVFATTRLPERDALFKWIGPLESADWVLLGRADRQFALRTLDDARTLRIGTYNGDARDAFLRERGFLVESAPNDIINPQKLLLGRIDLWAASLGRGSVMLEQNGWAGRIVPVLTFRKVDVYLACHRSLPDGLVKRMNDAIGAMQRDGTMRKIEQQYETWRPAVRRTLREGRPPSSGTTSR